MAPSSSRETNPNMGRAEEVPTKILTPTQVLLDELLRRSLILSEDWAGIPEEVRDQLKHEEDRDQLLHQLVTRQLLTPYQAQRIGQGQLSGMILGLYRVLDKLGAGGMAMVFKAEHMLMRRLAALKVMLHPLDDAGQSLPRFLAEIRSLAQLHHPHIVAALDAGKTAGSDASLSNCYYLVMEYVPGPNLTEFVKKQGPLAPGHACELICQVASALAEAHQHQIIHRDIKPSNILITPEGQAKLTDFGLARPFRDRHLTQTGTILGSIDFIAPEQARDSTSIDQRADLFSLGGTLFWCLTGQLPYPAMPSLAEDLNLHQTQPPQSIKKFRLDIPLSLEKVLDRMMAMRPEDRYPTAQAVIQALLPFLSSRAAPALVPSPLRGGGTTYPPKVLAAGNEGDSSIPRAAQILVVDDSRVGRSVCRLYLEDEGFQCDEAADGKEALAAFEHKTYDLVLLDLEMPEMSGPEVLKHLREHPPCPNLKIVLLSGASPEEMASYMAAGADDFLPKQPGTTELVARVKAALTLKNAQDRTDLLNRHLLALNAELERNLSASSGDLIHSRNSLVLALAELAELRLNPGPGHLLRLQRYCRLLGEEAARLPVFAGQIDDTFLDLLECCVPLHDIGQIALPDHILRKAGKLEPEERLILQAHTTLGADMLQRIAQRHCSALAFLQMAIDIARHHHEAFDGTGYPDRLTGSAIPLVARIVALADVYDALRSPRPHRPPLAHQLTVELIRQDMANRFDPHLLKIFLSQAEKWSKLFQEIAG